MRFRVLFWLVVLFGVLPETVSGLALLSTHGVGKLCAVEHDMLPVAAFQRMIFWERLHAVGRWGALVAGALVLAYAASWAALKGLSRARRWLLGVVLVAVLLPSLTLALATGRAVPWQNLRPGVTLGDSPRTLQRSPEEGGGPAYCREHPQEVSHLRMAWLAHVLMGLLAVGLTVGLADFGARWRAARDATDAKG